MGGGGISPGEGHVRRRPYFCFVFSFGLPDPVFVPWSRGCVAHGPHGIMTPTGEGGHSRLRLCPTVGHPPAPAAPRATRKPLATGGPRVATRRPRNAGDASPRRASGGHPPSVLAAVAPPPPTPTPLPSLRLSQDGRVGGGGKEMERTDPPPPPRADRTRRGGREDAQGGGQAAAATAACSSPPPRPRSPLGPGRWAVEEAASTVGWRRGLTGAAGRGEEGGIPHRVPSNLAPHRRWG